MIVWSIPAVMQSASPGPKICQELNYIYYSHIVCLQYIHHNIIYIYIISSLACIV